MDRTLRALAIIALLATGLFLALVQGFDRTQQPAIGESALSLLPALLPGILVNFLGQTSYALSLAVGVVAVVACVQRRQPVWAIVLIALLFVAATAPSLAIELSPLLDDPQFLMLAPYVGLVLDALVSLVVLGYTFAPRSQIVQPATIAQ